MKRKFLSRGFLFAIGLFLVGPTAAQTTDSVLKAHPEYTASGYALYPAPEKSIKYTKAPKGYKPFYISHYGRHGSRYHYSADDYKYLYTTLFKADSLNKLSEIGKAVLQIAKNWVEHASPKTGDLSQIGVKQHEDIAKRMAKNFPEVFKNSRIGEKKVEAFASTSGRCILSMSAFLGELRVQNPQLEIVQRTGKSYMNFINSFSFDSTKNYAETSAFKAENEKLWKNISPERLIKSLFTDSAYAAQNLNKMDFYNKLFEVSTSVAGYDDDLDKQKMQTVLNSLFTTEEKINRWKAQNAWWYSILGTCPLTASHGVTFAKPTLKKILEDADNAIYLDTLKCNSKKESCSKAIAATLRFGHDTGIMPLAGLMELSIADAQVSDLSKLHESWTDFKIIPMAANIQIVFYHSAESSKAKKSILVKFLYNEIEQELPIECEADSQKECPVKPYYNWEDVRRFFEKKVM